MQLELTAVYRKDPAGGYSAYVEEVPGANSQGETLDEARANLREAVTLVIEANRGARCRGRGRSRRDPRATATHRPASGRWNESTSHAILRRMAVIFSAKAAAIRSI